MGLDDPLTADEYEAMARDYASNALSTDAYSQSVTKQVHATLSNTYATLSLAARIKEQKEKE